MKFHVAILAGAITLMTACSQSDAGISATIKNRLIADDTVKARSIDVDTKDRVVTLTGKVRTKNAEAKAVKIARETRGVAYVVNKLTIGVEPETAATSGQLGEGGADRPPTDTGITARVKTRLLADPLVNGLDIDVDTNDRIVTLTGKVPSQAAEQRALDLARRADGVIRVEDRLVVQPPLPPR